MESSRVREFEKGRGEEVRERERERETKRAKQMFVREFSSSRASKRRAFRKLVREKAGRASRARGSLASRLTSRAALGTLSSCPAAISSYVTLGWSTSVAALNKFPCSPGSSLPLSTIRRRRLREKGEGRRRRAPVFMGQPRL